MTFDWKHVSSEVRVPSHYINSLLTHNPLLKIKKNKKVNTLYSIQHIHINLTLIHCTFYILLLDKKNNLPYSPRPDKTFLGFQDSITLDYFS